MKCFRSPDLNGNMLSDGANAFSWNARNQVATLNSVSLQYDGFGRRTKNLQNTSFLFDGANTVQELSGLTPTANLISGGIDEIFTRADSSGAYTSLKDALGSTIALVDASGGLVTQYAYDPFGNTAVSGAANSNNFQYTSRENDGNGLYFYRARYYSPVLHRFISEDPLGFAGSGPNFYGYAFNNPTNLVDPSGMSVGVDEIGTALRGIGATQTEIDEVVERILQLGGAGWLARLGAYCATNPVCLLAAVDVGLAINDGIGVYHLGQAYGWWGQPKRTPPRNPAPSLAGRNCKVQPGHSEGDCDDMYEADLETCRKLKSRACYAQAAERYAACKAGKPIPPLPFRLPN
jgi:RHS repeat-associated protein